MMRAELDAIVCTGPRRGKQFPYALLDERAPKAESLEREEALAELARRYSKSRRPATVPDFAKWSGLTIADARHGLDGIKAELLHETIGGRSYWFSTTMPSAKVVSPTAYLMSIYDEYISGYKDRSAIGDETDAAKLQALGSVVVCG